MFCFCRRRGPLDSIGIRWKTAVKLGIHIKWIWYSPLAFCFWVVGVWMEWIDGLTASNGDWCDRSERPIGRHGDRHVDSLSTLCLHWEGGVAYLSPTKMIDGLNVVCITPVIIHWCGHSHGPSPAACLYRTVYTAAPTSLCTTMTGLFMARGCPVRNVRLMWIYGPHVTAIWLGLDADVSIREPHGFRIDC